MTAFDGAQRQEEIFFSCPSCWQRVSILVDLSAGTQEFVEDCEVCCRPLNFRCELADGTMAELAVSDAV